MKNLTLLGMGVVCFFVGIVNQLEAQGIMNPLQEKEQKIVAVAGYAAKGDQVGLKKALTAGLDAGVSVNEFKEILVQVYAYCGFPRSLNALETFMTLLNERGPGDAAGNLPGPLPEGKSLDFGTVNQTKLCGSPVKGPLFDFAPAIDEFLKAHLFGDIFARDNLDWRSRELATVALLAAMTGVEPQLAAHIAIAKKNGLTDEQIEAILEIVRREVLGQTEAWSETSEARNPSSFPLGGENTGFAQYFSGRSWLAPLTKKAELGVPVFNVTFEPGCRNNWHRHTGGQILIAVGGVGYYQERGQAARRLVSGDLVEIPPDVDHWHGASPTDWFSHLAVECHPDTNKNSWLEPVSDADYQAATSEGETFTKPQKTRLSKIRVDAERLDEYRAFLKEEIADSMKKEPGVLTLYAVSDKDDPTRITILEIYANDAAYQSHLQTPHFRKYKEGTREMVKELELNDVCPLIPGLKIK